MYSISFQSGVNFGTSFINDTQYDIENFIWWNIFSKFDKSPKKLSRSTHYRVYQGIFIKFGMCYCLNQQWNHRRNRITCERYFNFAATEVNICCLHSSGIIYCFLNTYDAMVRYMLNRQTKHGFRQKQIFMKSIKILVVRTYLTST